MARWLPFSEMLEARRVRASDYRAVFGTEQGQRVLADILKRAQVGEDVTVRGDAHGTAIRLGRQLGAHWIAKQVFSGDAEILRRLHQDGEPYGARASQPREEP